jgi:hypothetical protein
MASGLPHMIPKTTTEKTSLKFILRITNFVAIISEDLQVLEESLGGVHF